MKILLVNPPNCGRSIPEERYGIDSIKQIFRGEPLALEVLAGSLIDHHEVKITDLKAAPDTLAGALDDFRPDLVGFTGVTCEAPTVVKMAGEVRRQSPAAKIAVGGIHASIDPDYYNRPEIDFIAMGLAKRSFQELVCALEDSSVPAIAGIIPTSPGSSLAKNPRQYSANDLLDHLPPAYGLVEEYRESYTLKSLDLDMGFVATAFGCPHNCSFCCIKGLTGGRYLTHSNEAVLRDIALLGDIPIIRLLDANTFGNPRHAADLCRAITGAGIKKQFLADVRADTVVNQPELIRRWKEAGLRAVIIGFEEIDDSSLQEMNKASQVAINTEAIKILHEIGITIIGDFILSPSYEEADFIRLEEYITDNRIDLPMITVLTPLPGTDLYHRVKDQIILADLDYYTLTNAVTPTRMPEQEFYEYYAALIKRGHDGAKL